MIFILSNFDTMLYQNIKRILEKVDIPYQEIHHEVSQSCEHSMLLRKEAWLAGIGSKNIVFHAKGNFYLVTTLWDKDIKARNFKSEFWTKDIRFASQDEITASIEATIWSIPPFWFINQDIPFYVDKEIFENDFFIFNPGIWDVSVQVRTSDLKKIYNELKNPVTFFDFRDEKKEFEKKWFL